MGISLRSTRFLVIPTTPSKSIRLWFFAIPPFVWPEYMNQNWSEVIRARCLMRRIKYGPGLWPPISMDDLDLERIRELREFRVRRDYWETWPRIPQTIFLNARVLRLRRLNGTRERLNELREFYVKTFERRAIILALLAAIPMGALAVLSIDSGHWMAQALWFASSALAVSGVLIASLTPVVFDTFFAEDLAALDLEHGLDHGQEEAMERKDSTSSHKHLTLQSHAVLLHEIDMFIDSYKIYITVSGYCFIAGLVAFFASVRPIDTSCKIQTLPFALVSGLPAAIGWTYTVTRGFYLSWKHRLFREGLLPDPDADNYTSRVRLQEPPSHGQLPILNNGRPLDGEAQECLNFPPMHVAAPTPAAALPGNVQQSSPCISQSSTP